MAIDPNDPWLAMAMQGIQNLGNMRMRQPVQTSPLQAYQQTVLLNARLNQQKQQEQRAQQSAQTADLVARAQLAKALQPQRPSAFAEKLGVTLQSMGMDPNNYDPSILQTDDFADAWSQFQGSPQVAIDMGQETEDKWQEAILTRNIDNWNTMKDDAARARTREQRLNTMLQYSNLFEGGGEIGDLQQWARNNLSALGYDVAPDANARQLFDALATQNQFERTALLKGSISEKELGLAGLMDSTSTNTREGREYILNYRLAEARRAQQIDDAAEAWMERTGQRYDERAFMNSPEYKQLAQVPMVTPRLLELGSLNHPDAFSDYVKHPDSGEWYLITETPDGQDLVPVFPEY